MTNYPQLGAALAVAISISTPDAMAHGDSGGGGGTVLPPGVTLVSVEVDVTRYKPLSDAQLNAAGPGPHAISQIAVPSLSLAYGLAKNFTIAARLPYLANSGIKERAEADPSVVNDRGGVYGFGDVSLTGTWRFLQDAHRGFEAMLVFGVKAPTGRTDAVDRFGERFETHHQPGSGSWDGLIGGGISQRLGAGYAVSANVLYARAGDGAADTNIGDRLSYAIAATHRMWSSGAGAAPHMHLGGPLPAGMMHHGGVDHSAPSSSRPMALDVSLGLGGQWSDKVRTAGIADADTGGNVLSITPGLRLTVGSWASFVNVGVPVAKDLNGLQSEPRWQLSTGLSTQF